jgi:hypothetical protein
MKNRVQRFRSGEEMAEASVLAASGDGFERFARHCARYFALSPRHYLPGLFRFRSIEDAQAARVRITLDFLRANRSGSPVGRS